MSKNVQKKTLSCIKMFFNKFLTIFFDIYKLYSAYSVLTLYLSVNVRLSYRFRASISWMLSSLFIYISSLCSHILTLYKHRVPFQVLLPPPFHPHPTSWLRHHPANTQFMLSVLYLPSTVYVWSLFLSDTTYITYQHVTYSYNI